MQNTKEVKKASSKFAILTKNSKVKKEVIEIDNKVACIPSFVGKTISLLTKTSSRFYHRSIQELRMEEENRIMTIVWSN